MVAKDSRGRRRQGGVKVLEFGGFVFCEQHIYRSTCKSLVLDLEGWFGEGWAHILQIPIYLYVRFIFLYISKFFLSKK